jgi:hypothetical protein
MYFAQAGRLDLARAVARDALVFAAKIPEHERLNSSQISRTIGALTNMLTGTRSDD